MTDRHSPHSERDHEPHEHLSHPDLSWFLRRELLTIPLVVIIVGILLVVGISPATLLFVALLTILVLGLVWSSK